MVSHWGHQCDLASPSPLATSGLVHLRAPYTHFLGHNMETRWTSLGESTIADACFAQTTHLGLSSTSLVPDIQQVCSV